MPKIASTTLCGANVCPGTEIYATEAVRGSQYSTLIRPGEAMKIIFIYKNRGEGIRLGLYSKKYKDGWHDLEGHVDTGHGWWFEDHEAESLFRAKSKIKIIASFEFKNKNLKGMSGRLLAPIENTSLIFIELKEKVGGCSGDGLGKKGCCVAIDKDLIKISS